MSRLDSGILRWRHTISGSVGDVGNVGTHADAAEEDAYRGTYWRHWIKGCPCGDCEAARGANDDEASE